MKKSVEELALQYYPDESYPIGDRDRFYDPNYKERLAFIKGMRVQEERSCAPEMLNDNLENVRILMVCLMTLKDLNFKDNTFLDVLKEKIEKSEQLIKKATEI